MKISLNLIKKYIPGWEIDSVDSLTNKMISTGLDIESVEDEGKVFDKLIIGEVIEKQKHPNADKLSLCKVDTGDKVLSIVCGAPNVDKAQKVCVAVEGAFIPNGGFEIKRSKIRGELSEGMICSAKELNLSEDHDGILVLGNDAKIGQSFAEYIKANDIIFELGITPNRGDLFSHFGVAREVAALYNKKISIPEVNITESATPTTDLLKISIENADLCKRFTGRVIRNIEIKESPEWLKRILISMGLRPKNVIVDITNFVMMETGQPLHAFDYDKIRGKEIIVRNAKDKDKFVTLDSKERVLNSESLMVCDNEGYSGIAGIMGGKYSEITNDTKNIFIESAYFDPVNVRKNSKRLGLQTDASQRFERGIDIDMVEYASLRAAQLICELSGGEVSKKLYDVYPEKFIIPEVAVRLSKVNELIGLDLNEQELIKLLEKIEIKFLRKENESLIFAIPEFRRLDIEREIDLIEETARIYGYDNIEGDTHFNVNVLESESYGNSKSPQTKEIVNHLIGRGFNQILTDSLDDEKRIKSFSDGIVRLANSVTSELNSLRANMIPGMLRVIADNFNNSGKNISLKLFEIGKVFSDNGNKFTEEDRLIIAMSGKRDSEIIYGGENDFDLFDIKGEVEMFLSKLNLENFTLIYYYNETLDGAKIDIRLRDELIGIIYKADSSLKKEFEIESDVYFAEIYQDRILANLKKAKQYRKISKFPSVKRDLAIVVDSKLSYEELKNIILKSGGELLKNILIFDMYEDNKLGENKKSLAFTLEFSSKEKTLTDEETNKVVSKIISNLEKTLGAKLRT